MDESTAKGAIDATAEAFTETARAAADVSELAFILCVVAGLICIVITIVSILNWFTGRQEKRAAAEMSQKFLGALVATNDKHAENGERQSRCLEELSETGRRLCDLTDAAGERVDLLVKQSEHNRAILCDALELAECHATSPELRQGIGDLKRKAEEHA